MCNKYKFIIKEMESNMRETRSVGESIMSLNNIIKRNLYNSENHIPITRVTTTNTWVIGFLAKQNSMGKDVYQKDLEQAFGITRSTVSKVINIMVQKGLVERQPVERDARLKKLVLTPEAIRICELMCMDGRKLETVITAGFSEKELKELLGYFERIRKNLESQE
jgi:MarR family transcriptional repressor of mepA